MLGCAAALTPLAAHGQTGSVPPTAAARIEVRLSQLERSITRLTARIEDLEHKLDKSNKTIERLRNDLEFRLSRLEGGKPPVSSPGPTPSATRNRAPEKSPEPDLTPPPVSLPQGSPSEQYRFAIDLLRRAEYKKAAGALSAFIKLHPRHPLTGNAYYWLGETFYAQSDYQQAAVHFADGFRAFPKHPKAPDNLLKLGMSFARLDKKPEACATFAELRKRYPTAASEIRKADVQRRRLNCR